MGNKNQKKCNNKVTVEKINAEIEIENSNQLLREAKMNNRMSCVEKIFLFVLKIIGLILFLTLLIGTFVFLIWWIVIYCKGDTIANTVLTIMQVVTGIISLVVGVWALVLAIKSERRVTDTEKYFNIRKSYANSNVSAKLNEPDVNKDSL